MKRTLTNPSVKVDYYHNSLDPKCDCPFCALNAQIGTHVVAGGYDYVCSVFNSINELTTLCDTRLDSLSPREIQAYRKLLIWGLLEARDIRTSKKKGLFYGPRFSCVRQLEFLRASLDNLRRYQDNVSGEMI